MVWKILKKEKHLSWERDSHKFSDGTYMRSADSLIHKSTKGNPLFKDQGTERKKRGQKGLFISRMKDAQETVVNKTNSMVYV